MERKEKGEERKRKKGEKKVQKKDKKEKGGKKEVKNLLILPATHTWNLEGKRIQHKKFFGGKEIKL